MMMPANYSAVAENEMTYVVGGWSGTIGPNKEISTLISNTINIVGNSFVSKVVAATLGKVFGGEYTFGAVTTGITTDLKGKDFLNGGLAVVGGLFAIAQLANNTVKNKTANTIMGITGAGV